MERLRGRRREVKGVGEEQDGSRERKKEESVLNLKKERKARKEGKEVFFFSKRRERKVFS